MSTTHGDVPAGYSCLYVTGSLYLGLPIYGSARPGLGQGERIHLRERGMGQAARKGE